MNTFKNDEPLIFKQRSIDIDNQKYISEVESLLEYFYKIKHTSINRKLVSKIFSNFNFNFAFAFYYYEDSLFDVSISLRSKWNSKYIKRKEELINLEAPFNSSILSRTLEKGSQIKQLIFSNRYDGDVIDDPDIHISFSNKTLTIDWLEMNPDYLNLLLELGPGLILRLNHLKNWGDEKLNLIQRLLIYREGSPLYWKLSFSKVLINIDIEIDEIKNIEFFVALNKLKHLIDSLSNIYDFEFENISYEDLFRDRVSQFKEFIERQRNMYNNQKLKFEWELKYSRIEYNLDDFFNNEDDCINQTISKLKLKEFEFYADKIHMDRYD